MYEEGLVVSETHEPAVVDLRVAADDERHALRDLVREDVRDAGACTVGARVVAHLVLGAGVQNRCKIQACSGRYTKPQISYVVTRTGDLLSMSGDHVPLLDY